MGVSLQYLAAVTRRVLVVDDDLETCEMMAQLLEFEGFEARMATNGRDALDQLASGFRPDVIVLDLMMPVMDGRQFLQCRHADSEYAAIPVVVLSAASDRLSSVTADAVLRKPINVAELVDKLRQYTPRFPR